MLHSRDVTVWRWYEMKYRYALVLPWSNSSLFVDRVKAPTSQLIKYARKSIYYVFLAWIGKSIHRTSLVNANSELRHLDWISHPQLEYMNYICINTSMVLSWSTFSWILRKVNTYFSRISFIFKNNTLMLRPSFQICSINV